MRIERIELANFRNFELAAFDLSNRTFLAGPNGAGKSTIIDAMSWGLRGVCRGTDARGAGSKDLIRTGADAATVTLHTDILGAITRTVGRNGSSQATMKTDAILAKLDTTDAALEAVLYGRAFFGLHHKDAKNLLLRILDVRIPVADLPGVDLGTQPAADLDTLDLLYKAAFDNRAAAKKALAAVFVPDLPKMVSLERDPVALAAQATKARMAERQAAADLGKLTTELHKTVQARQRLKPINADELRGKRLVHGGLLADETQKATAAAARLADLEDVGGLTAADLGGKTADLKGLITKIQAHDPDRGCILNAAIPCQTDAKQFAAQVKTLKAQIKDLDGQIKAANARTADLGQARQAKADADRAVTYHGGQIAQIDRDLATADDVDEQISRLDADRDRLAAAVDAAKTVVDDAVQTSGTLAEQAQAASAYQNAVQARQGAEDKRVRLQADLDAAEALVALLGPNGIRAGALQDAVEDFEAAINAGLDGFGFRLAIQADPWEVAISRDGVTFLPFDLLSDGEKLWTGVCFQQALATVTGLGIVAVDATETVVGMNRAMLTRLIMLSPVDQIVIAMAKGEADALPDIDGLQVIQVSKAGIGPA